MPYKLEFDLIGELKIRCIGSKMLCLQKTTVRLQQNPPHPSMAIIRNLVITLFRRAGHRSLTAAIDRFSNDLNQLLPMLDFPSA